MKNVFCFLQVFFVGPTRDNRVLDPLVVLRLDNRLNIIVLTYFITESIQAGANLMLMCAQIATKIDQEQNKTLWVSSGTIW